MTPVAEATPTNKGAPKPLAEVIKIDESLIRGHLDRVVRESVEQTLNALYLERLGYGRHATALDKPTLDAFLRDVPRCAEALKGYTQDGNRLMLDALDEQIQLAARGR